MKIVVNAISAKNFGGGFQVSLNFILRTLNDPRGIDWYYIVSKPLWNEITKRINNDCKIRFFVFPAQPDFTDTYLRVAKQVRRIEKELNPDLIYSILAPSYLFFRTTEVMRFTYPWMTNPNEYANRLLTQKERIRMKLHDFVVKFFLRRCKYFITQTNTAKKGISTITKIPLQNICVINNTLPEAFYREVKTTDKTDDNINVACIGGPSVHKNFDIIPDVLDCLVNNYKIKNCVFHVTIPESDYVWNVILKKLKVKGLEKHVVNYGKVSQSKLAAIYRKCSISYLPSLLEVFSATPLESMFFNLSIVATNFDFNTEVIGNAGVYCIPMDPQDAAARINDVINNSALRKQLSQASEKVLKRYSDFNSYYSNTIKFFQEIIKSK